MPQRKIKQKLNRGCKLPSQLDGLPRKLYESFASGYLTEKRFMALSDRYEREQDAGTDRSGQFLEPAKRYTDFSVLSVPLIHEFADMNDAHVPDRFSGMRMQEVNIYLKFIGKFDAPLPEQPAVCISMQAASLCPEQERMIDWKS